MRRWIRAGSHSMQIDDAVVHGDRERLRAAHAAEPRGDGDGAGQGAAEPLVGDRGEGLEGALEDALGADVDPRAGGHLAVHREPEVLEPAELLPVRPVADQVGVGDQHPRRPLVGPHHAHRLARLHEHRLVVGQRRQRAHEGVVGLPVAGRLAGAAVDDEVLGALGVLGVEVVHQHPQRRLGLPGPGGQLGAVRGVDGQAFVHTLGHASHPTPGARVPPSGREVGQSRIRESVRQDGPSGPFSPSSPAVSVKGAGTPGGGP